MNDVHVEGSYRGSFQNGGQTTDDDGLHASLGQHPQQREWFTFGH